MSSIIVEFVGGGFVVITDISTITIFVNRWDANDIKYLIIDGKEIDGKYVKSIKGKLAKSRVKFI